MVLEHRAVAYCRVSTKHQGADGLGIAAQQDAVRRFCKQRGMHIVAELVEVESGGKDDRPVLNDALVECRRRKAVLVVSKLDRLARSVGFLERLRESKVKFVVAEMPEANELTLTLLMAVAQHERKLASDRTRAALAMAQGRVRPDGTVVRLGGRRWGLETVGDKARAVSAQRRHAKAVADAADFKDFIASCRKRGLTSLRQIADALNSEGYETSMGCQWSATQVSRVLTRLA